MPARPKEFTCRGINRSVTLHENGMTITADNWRKSKSHELPLNRIESVIVQRKSVVPFASLTIFAAIAAVITRFNALWFIFPLDPPRNLIFSTPPLIAAIVFAIPTLSRAFFVEVVISWEGRPKSFLVRLVPAGRGSRLARHFQRISAGN